MNGIVMGIIFSEESIQMIPRDITILVPKKETILIETQDEKLIFAPQKQVVLIGSQEEKLILSIQKETVVIET